MSDETKEKEAIYREARALARHFRRIDFTASVIKKEIAERWGDEIAQGVDDIKENGYYIDISLDDLYEEKADDLVECAKNHARSGGITRAYRDYAIKTCAESEEYTIEYLKASMEAFHEDGDWDALLIAIHTIAKAYPKETSDEPT